MNTFILSKIQRILFPLSLTLFEFSVYIANDMIQPAMLEITKIFHADIKWIPTSMTAYIAGGFMLQWLWGPLSDKRGRRPIMLMGILFFIISCLAILLVSNIEQFMIMRFLQGISLCFIGSVGYATIQEVFNESTCIKIISLMANITILAPLIGPLTGATLINIMPWQGIFIIFAIIASISFIGLFLYMPETVINKNKNFSLLDLWNNYKIIFKNLKFINGSIAIGCATIPLLAWIAISPVIIITEQKLSMLHYALLQIPIFSGLIIGNLTLNFLSRKKILKKLIIFSTKPLIIGLLISSISIFYDNTISLYIIIIGLSIYAFGLGISNSCLIRLTLFSTIISKGTVSSAMGMIHMLIFIIGIEISKNIYLWNKENAFNLLNLFYGLCWLILTMNFIKKTTSISTIKK